MFLVRSAVLMLIKPLCFRYFWKSPMYWSELVTAMEARVMVEILF